MPENARPKKFRAARMLAGGSTIKAAADAAQVDEKTVRRWKTDPDFMAMVEKIQAAMFARAAARLTRVSATAVDELATLLGNPDARIRLTASRLLLDLGLKFREQLALADRLAKLEERMEDE